MLSQQNNLVVPYADQYVGVWSILERHGNALLQQAQQVNIQLHMEATEKPEAQASIAAQASTDLNITRDGVAIVELQGSLMKQASSMSASRSMVAARRQVRAAASNPDVVGILLHIDSPGGTVAGTIDLADDVAAAAKQKPVHAYVDDLCASAAYWIASQCNAIYSNRAAEVGSIGVFMAVTDWSAFAEKEGAKVNVIRFGEFKGAGIAGTEITEAQMGEWQKSVDNYGAKFIDAVASGRGMAKSQAKQLADGRIHAAEIALELKLIDGIQSLDKTLAGLVAAGKQPGGKKAMSENNTPEPLTSAQLKKALPKSTADFREEQIEAGATLAEAVTAWSAHVTAENEKLVADTERLTKELAEAKAKPADKTAGKPLGNQPIAGGVAEDTTGATEQWNDKIGAKVSKGIPRDAAARAVNRENPGLREAMLAECAASRRAG